MKDTVYVIPPLPPPLHPFLLLLVFLSLLDPQPPVTAGHGAAFAFDSVARRAHIPHGGIVLHTAHTSCLDSARTPDRHSVLPLHFWRTLVLAHVRSWLPLPAAAMDSGRRGRKYMKRQKRRGGHSWAGSRIGGGLRVFAISASFNQTTCPSAETARPSPTLSN